MPTSLVHPKQAEKIKTGRYSNALNDTDPWLSSRLPEEQLVPRLHRLQGGDPRRGASLSCYSAILRPNSVNATEGILNRSIACAELRDMNENSATRQRER
jgi:hypothetical protein